MKIGVIGAGYVGMVCAACLADEGHDVVCIDARPERVAALQQGIPAIHEPGLPALIAKGQAAGRITFSGDIAAVACSDVVFITVGTPARRGDGDADVTHVMQAACTLAEHLEGSTLVVLKSTVPVGTSEAVAKALHRSDATTSVASNPEFLREGEAVHDFRRPDRVVLGVRSPEAEALLKRLYEPQRARGATLLFTTPKNAELIKYASNAFLAMKVSFANELADVSEAFGTDINEVTRGMGLDPRIGEAFLRPGPGYGGSCFPKDTRALAFAASTRGIDTPLLDATIAFNHQRKRQMADRLVRELGTLDGRSIGILGVTFKPKTNDMRESPALQIVPSLAAQGARLKAYDPGSGQESREMLPDLQFVTDPYQALAGAEAAAILTDWAEFRTLDLDRVKALMAGNTVFDTRNLFSPMEMQRRGFRYLSIGRPPVG